MRDAAMKRFRAWLLLATFVATLGSSEINANHFGVTDTACGDTSLAARSEGVKFSNPSGAETEHCPVCHFLRAVSGANIASVACIALQDGVVSPVVTVAAIPPTIHPVTQPSRGPPVLTPSSVL